MKSHPHKRIRQRSILPLFITDGPTRLEENDMKKVLFVALLTAVLVTPGYAQTGHEGHHLGAVPPPAEGTGLAAPAAPGGTMSGMMGPGMMGMMGGGMMGKGAMGPATMPPCMQGGGGMAMGPRGGMSAGNLEGMLYMWAREVFGQPELNLTPGQLEAIGAIFSGHAKYAIRKLADRKILLMDLEEMLVQDKTDMGDVEKKLKALGAVETEMRLEGVRTMEAALKVLSPEQQKQAKSLMRKRIYGRFLRGMGGGMMGGMMGGASADAEEQDTE
jgi:Spy/CpxP family protein refolding chaperone